MSDDNAPITFTLKHGGGYGDAWTVFRGTPQAIRDNAVEFFGVDEADVEGLAAAEVLEAIKLAVQGSGISTKPKAPEKVELKSVDTAVAVETDEALLEQVKTAGSTDELNKLWKNNKAKFDKVILAAAGARKKELEEKESN